MDNCSSLLDPWALQNSFPESCWITDCFARDNEALTKALKISLSEDSSPSPSASAVVFSPDSLSAATSDFIFRPLEPSAEPAAEQAGPGSKRGRSAGSTGRIMKRKSRASKRSPTTYITADPANFRQMVQQVTGVRIGDQTEPVEPVFRPEPQRAGTGRSALNQSCLPTLDTSAFLLERAATSPASAAAGAVSGGSFAPAVEFPAFEFEPFPMFPTLESWGVMGGAI